MSQIICFIDDSGFEHELVQDEIASVTPHFEFVQAYTFSEARSLLKKCFTGIVPARSLGTG